MTRLDKLPVEILGEIGEMLDANTFRSLRLVCRELAAKSHDTFVRQHVRTVHANVDEDGFKRLVYLSRHDSFAPQVQTLHLYPSTLAQDFDRDRFATHFMRTTKGFKFSTSVQANAYLWGGAPRYRASRHAIAAEADHAMMVSRQSRFIDKPNLAIDLLIRALKKLPSITAIFVGTRDRTERLHSATGQLTTGRRHELAIGNTAQTWSILLKALFPLSIRELGIGQPGDSINTSLLLLSQGSSWALQVLQNSIRSLEICLGPPETNHGEEALSKFLTQATKLEELTLSGYYDVFPVTPALYSSILSLKRLVLKQCYVDPAVLRTFADRHRQTLNSIVLQSVILWTQGWHDLLDFLASEEIALDMLSLEHIRVVSPTGAFGCLVFEGGEQTGCRFCGQHPQETAEPCRHVRLSACNKDEFSGFREKLLQSECRII